MRYYESPAVGRNMGLGYGWTTKYTANLIIEPLYARVIFPKSVELYFDRDYGGTYKPVGVFCNIPDGAVCMCSYSHQYEGSVFAVGDKVILIIQHYDDAMKEIYGKIVAKW